MYEISLLALIHCQIISGFVSDRGCQKVPGELLIGEDSKGEHHEETVISESENVPPANEAKYWGRY